MRRRWCGVLALPLTEPTLLLNRSYSVTCGHFEFKQNLLAFLLFFMPMTFHLPTTGSQLATLLLTAQRFNIILIVL